MYVWWGRSKKKGRGVRGWWGKKMKKRRRRGYITGSKGGGKWERKVF